ncbi:RHS repeat-associated core domain-containing protein [Streptomyces sp. NPDC059629]|uniref:RHS repeat-associated core domain-containing protein n=1 Tax=Streptomyces sp. NPDC059629 TaxID=3346889 RepID=UPI0036D080F7
MTTLLGSAPADALRDAKPADAHRLWSPPGTPLPKTPSVSGRNARGATAPEHPEQPQWPGPGAARAVTAGTAVVTVPRTVGARAGNLPVWVKTARDTGAARPRTNRVAALAAGTPVNVRVLASKDTTALGTHGPVVAVSRSTAGADGDVQVGVDVSNLDAAYGGDAASRSHLVTLPACALTTPQRAACQVRTPLPSHYDPATHRLTAEVTLPAATRKDSGATTSASAVARPLVVAADTTASGGGGTYAATDLHPSDAWTAGGSSGGFSYRYPIQAPQSFAGDTPQVALSYDSSSVDGLTSSTNSQASWIGDGWSYQPGYVERSYKSCSKDGIAHSGDLCWSGDVATLSLGGHSSQLVRDDKTGVWRMKDDDGSKVEFLTGASNGIHSGEYVKVSTSTGNVYYFGLNHLPGGDHTDPATNSAWYEPVYSPKSSDPCYSATDGAASWCQMGWRFNLDYAVDAIGNLTTYTYQPETNYYQRGGGQNSGKGTLTAYVRGGALATIAYGQRLADQTAAKGALNPAARIMFTPATEGRCSVAGGFTCTGAKLGSGNAAHWPDVPYDENCAKGSTTCKTVGPTFWTTTRLKSITTQIRSGGAWKDIDSYALSQSYPDPQDGNKPAMWLDSIQRTGLDGSPSVSLPKVAFTWKELPNRVDGTSLVPSPTIFNRPRIQSITTETGEQIQVDYRLPACSRLSHTMPDSAATDTMACYNVKWSPPGSVDGAAPESDWFNRYQVDSVTENDPVAHSPAVSTHYDYGPAAWHFDDNELTDSAHRTWDDFRGFAWVTATTGSGQDGPKSQQKTVYLQGMDGDRNADGGSRPVTVTDSLGDHVTDSDWLSGLELETDTYDQSGGTVTAVSATTISGASTTATHARGSSLPDLVARYAGTRSVQTDRSRTSAGDWRTVTTTTLTDAAHANRTVSVETDADGQPKVCERTSYASATDSQVTGLADQALTVSGDDPCNATPAMSNTVSGKRTLFDKKPFGQAGTLGEATSQQVLDHYDDSGNPVYATTQTVDYDTYGRTTAVTDPNATDDKHKNGATTTTTYSSAQSGELPDTVTVTSPEPGSTDTWTATVTQDPARRLQLTSSDPNSRVTTEAYDALGRLTKVWTPGRTAGQDPNTTYTYAANGSSSPSTVTTATLTGDGPVYVKSVQIYDGFGRTRQIQQSPGISAYHGRVVTDTQYDSHGRTALTTEPYYDNDSAPSTSLFAADAATVPGETATLYDGQGRPTASVFSAYAREQWRTTTSYPGVDEVDTTPPEGGTPTTTVTDSLGRTSQMWQYRTPTATGKASDADVTTYTYTPSGKTESQVDSTTKNTWTYHYDLRGRQTTADDPDTGITSQTYDADGRIDTVTDARKVTLSFDYDLLGRKTAEYSTTAPSTTKVKEASWTYDSVAGGRGRAATSNRYLNGDTAHPYATAVASYDAEYRPTETSVTIPSTEGKLAGSYVNKAVYSPITGQVTASYTGPRGNLPAETLNYSYDVDGPLIGFGSSGTTYDLSTDYDAFGRPVRTTVNPWGTELVATDDYDLSTGNLLSSYVDKQTSATGSVQQTTYVRNDAGQLTAVRTIGDNSASLTDQQCFGYDSLGRLTDAWTDNDGVTTAPQPSVANIGHCTNSTPTSGATTGHTTVGGPAPYWNSYSYDATGNRTGEVQHDPTGDTAKDVSTRQKFPLAGQRNTPTTAPDTGGGTGGPHALQSTTATGPDNPGSSSYQYDAIGDTTAVNSTSGTTTLTWDADHELASLSKTGSTGPTTYVYDADGNLLLRRDPGSSTLTVGGDELTLTTATDAVTDTRTYDLPNGVSAVRQGTGAANITWQIADQNGTSTLALDGTSLAESRRPVDPFGVPRGTQPDAWAGDHGFVGGTLDEATGLTNLGAREYQPQTGRFLNADPVLDLSQPQQWNGYAYSLNDPVNFSDPLGTDPPGTQDTCAYDLSLCSAKQCAGVHGVPCGKKHQETIGAPGSKGGLSVGTDDGQPTLDGIRVPTKKELVVRFAARPTDSYGKLVLQWINGECSGETWGVAKLVKFCDDANAGGLLPKTDKDPIGVTDFVHCVSKGKDCGSFAVDLVSDALMAVPGVGEAEEGAIGAKAAVSAERDLGKEGVTDGLGAGKEGDGGLQETADACKAVNSFPGETRVLTDARGTSVALKDVQVGDRVLATDPLIGKTRPEKVQAVLKTLTDTDFTDLTVATGGGSGHLLTSTQHHPYWDVTRARWLDATDLRTGDALRLPDGRTARIVHVRDYTGHIVTYNLTVQDLHTYYVMVGATPVLVHNGTGGVAGTVFRDGAYKFAIFSNDHGPAHGHLMGPGIKGHGIQIGQNGKPVDPDVQLSRAQQEVIGRNLGAIRNAIRDSMAAYRLNRGC